MDPRGNARVHGEAIVLGAQELNKPWRPLYGQMKGYEVRDGIRDMPK